MLHLVMYLVPTAAVAVVGVDDVVVVDVVMQMMGVRRLRFDTFPASTSTTICPSRRIMNKYFGETFIGAQSCKVILLCSQIAPTVVSFVRLNFFI